MCLPFGMNAELAQKLIVARDETFELSAEKLVEGEGNFLANSQSTPSKIKQMLDNVED